MLLLLPKMVEKIKSKACSTCICIIEICVIHILHEALRGALQIIACADLQQMIIQPGLLDKKLCNTHH